nr:putative ribonuclease H-like domain-containing protein [Tanacetum cinerariifolium]
MQKKRHDVKARTTLLLALPDEHQLRFSKYETAQELWGAILKTFGGNEATKKTKKNQLNLAPEWLMYTIVWINRNDLDTLSLDDVYNHLKVYEPEVQKKSESNSQNMAFISSANTSSGKREVNTASIPTASTQVSPASTDIAAASITHDTVCAYIASQSNGSQIKYKDINQIDEDDIEEMDIKWNMALLSMRADRFWKKTGKKITIQGTDVAGFDKSKVEYFNCHKMGHFARECRAPRSQDRGRREIYKQGSKEEEPAPKALMAIDGVEARLVEFKTQEIKFCEKIRGLEFNVKVKNNKIENLMNELEQEVRNLIRTRRVLDTVLFPPPAQVYSPPKKDMSWIGLPKFVDDTITDYSRTSPSIEMLFPPPAQVYSPPKKDMSWIGLPKFVDDTITDYSRTSPSIETDSPTDIKTNKVESVRKSYGNSQNNIDDKGYWDSGYWDSGCSRHMTGNISYLFDYEPYDGGYVSFGQGGGKITGKGIIKTGKLEFQNVYFVKDLKYNLFSVSQICDNKNSVLFNDFECIVLGRDFKLKDDTNALLRTPRQHNMYSIDLNNIVPHKDLTYLVAKASADESMLWHRRLCHLNFKTMNKTPQQNRVAERRNRTLIEAARTMLADAKLPVTFWAEAVNATCYVQNRVLVNNGNSNPTATSKNPSADQMETLTVESAIPTISSPVPTACSDDSSEPSSDTRHISKGVTSQDETPSLDNISTLSNRGKAHWHKMVLKNKKDERGIMIRFQARLVAQGHTHEEGIDYEEVFAPVARIKAIRLFLAYASFMGFTVYQMDVKSAFLYGTINEEVYVMQPPGFQDPQFPDRVYKVEKVMYGLYQAPRAWYGTLSKYLLAYGFQRGTIDQTLFIRKHRGDFLLVQVYADDIIFGSSNECYGYLKGHPKLGLWYLKESPFDLVAYSDSDYGGATQDKKSTTGGHNVDFHQIVDFVKASNIRIKTTNEGTKILATVNGKPMTISKSSIRRNLKLNDKEGISSLPDAVLFENLALMGYNILPNQKFTFQKEIPTLRQYSRRATRIAQSKALPTAADEPASLLRDDSQGEAFPTVSGLEAGQDRENIIKTSTLPHDSTPRVTSLDADEGSMQQQLQELTDLCTRLQMQQAEMASKIIAQDLEISSLKARIKLLKDKDKGSAELSGDDALIKGRSMEIGEEAGGTERGSNNTKELVNILTSIDAANILTSRVQAVSVPPVAEVSTVGVPTSSGLVPTVSAIFTIASMVTPYSRRKGKEKMVESDTLKKKKLQEQIDVQVAREIEEEMAREYQRLNEQIARDVEIAKIHAEEELQMLIDGLDRNNEVIAKHLQEYEQSKAELTIREKIELINELVKYQDHHAKILKYQAQQSKPLSKKEQREFYMSVLRSHSEWKTKRFRAMTLEEIREKFIPIWKQIEDFVPMASKEEEERLKRKGLKLEQGSAKKMKTSQDESEEDLKEMMQLVPVEEIYVEALQVKHPIIDWEIHIEGKRDYWKIIRLGGHTTASSDKEKELWVELKRMFEPDFEDQLDQEIFMLVERDYPLRKGLAIVMISNKLQPEWSRFVTIVKQQHKLDEVSYHKLFDILKQYQKEVNELRAKRFARNANPLALVATAQANQGPYNQTSRSHKSHEPSSKPSILTRSHTTTRHKGKEIAKPITPPSETASEEDSNPEQAQRDNDMKKNLALIAKYFKKIYKPTNNNLRTSSNSRNKNVDKNLQYKNDNQSGHFRNQRTVNVADARENECKKPKRVKDSAYHKEKMWLCKQAEQGIDSEPVEQVQNKAGYNVFANDLQHFEQSESVSNTCLVETDDSNVIPNSPDIKSLGESISVRDSCLVALQNKQTEFEKYKAFNDRTIDYDKLERKLNETLGQLAQKDIEIKEGLKTKAYEILVVKEKHDELIKWSLLTNSHYEGIVKQKTKVIMDLKLRKEHDIDKMLSMEKQLKFLKEIVFKRSQSIRTIHMMEPKVPTYNGRPTFANPRYLKQAQSKIPCLYAFPYDQSTHANRLILDGEETLALERENLKAQLQDKNIAISELKKLIEKGKGKYVDTKFDRPSIVRQPNDQRIPKPSVLEGLSKPVTVQTLPQTAKKALSKQTESVSKKFHIEVLQRFAKVEKHLISLEFALQKCKEQVKNDTVCNEKASNLFQKEREQYIKIQDLKAKLQDKNIAISELKKLIEKGKGKSVDTKFDRPSIVRQPNAQRIPKPSVLDCTTHPIDCLLWMHEAHDWQSKAVEMSRSTVFITSKALITISSQLVNFVMWIWRVLSGSQYDLLEIFRATPNQAWLWHRRLSHLNFNYINLLLKKDIMISLPKLKDGENLDKMKEKGDRCILVGYSTQSKGYQVYNKRTRMIVESIHICFDEIKEVSETSVANNTSVLVPQRQKASDYDNPDSVPQRQDVSSLPDADVPSQQELDLLFGPLYDEFFNADSTPQDKQPSTNIPSTSAPSTHTNVHAEENNNDQGEKGE